jgi:hypothetical protein
MTRLENITMTIITIPLNLSPLYLIFLVRLGRYVMNLCDLYFYKIIGILTVFFAASVVQHVKHNCGTVMLWSGPP